METPEQVERHRTLHRGRGTVKDVYMYTWLPTCQMWPPSYLHNTTRLCLLTPPQTLPCSPDDSAATAHHCDVYLDDECAAGERASEAREERHSKL